MSSIPNSLRLVAIVRARMAKWRKMPPAERAQRLERHVAQDAKRDAGYWEEIEKGGSDGR